MDAFANGICLWIFYRSGNQFDFDGGREWLSQVFLAAQRTRISGTNYFKLQGDVLDRFVCDAYDLNEIRYWVNDCESVEVKIHSLDAKTPRSK
jgi:hypothetical protein